MPTFGNLIWSHAEVNLSVALVTADGIDQVMSDTGRLVEVDFKSIRLVLVPVGLRFFSPLPVSATL